MGALISLIDYKKKKYHKEVVYGSYTEWVARRFRGHHSGATSRYDLAVEEQQDDGFYLFKYWFPDYDW